MKKISLAFLFFLSFISYSQNNYFINNGDTIFCQSFMYKLTIQSYLASIEYTDMQGNHLSIKGRKNLAGVSSFYRNGTIIDKIPQKANKPKSYVKWAERVVDGKLKVNYYNNQTTTFGMSRGSVTTSITKFFIKMPDGTFYDIRKSGHRKKYIIPYLQNCEAFNSAYKGNFESDYDSFIKIIELYNSVCK